MKSKEKVVPRYQSLLNSSFSSSSFKKTYFSPRSLVTNVYYKTELLQDDWQGVNLI